MTVAERFLWQLRLKLVAGVAVFSSFREYNFGCYHNYLLLPLLVLIKFTTISRTPKGNGKKFEIAGFRNNRGSLKYVTMNHFLIKYSTV